MIYVKRHRVRSNGMDGLRRSTHRRFDLSLWPASVEEARKMNDLKPNGKLDVRELNRRLHRIHLFLTDGNAPAARQLLEKTIEELEQPNPLKK